MTRTIPQGPLVLGLAGLLPFVWGALTMFVDPLLQLTVNWLGPRFVGPFVIIAYGRIILAFMSGVLWGFATKGTSAFPYILSVIPALWIFFAVGDGPVSAAIYLAAGFIGLLLLDFLFWQQKLAPPWWMWLRLILTAGVLVCLAPVIL